MRITTIVRNNLPMPHCVDVSISAEIPGRDVESLMTHLSAVMTQCGFDGESLHDYIMEYAAEENEERDNHAHSLLARAAETLQHSGLRTDRELAGEINEFLTGREDDCFVNLGGGPSFDLSDAEPEDGDDAGSDYVIIDLGKIIEEMRKERAAKEQVPPGC